MYEVCICIYKIPHIQNKPEKNQQNRNKRKKRMGRRPRISDLGSRSAGGGRRRCVVSLGQLGRARVRRGGDGPRWPKGVREGEAGRRRGE